MLQVTHKPCGFTFIVGDGKGNDRLPNQCPNQKCPEPTRAEFEIISVLGESEGGIRTIWQKPGKERL